ncbi:hypothetical protein MCEMIH16_02148 [Caulobacteraceae bacterium]
MNSPHPAPHLMQASVPDGRETDAYLSHLGEGDDPEGGGVGGEVVAGMAALR